MPHTDTSAPRMTVFCGHQADRAKKLRRRCPLSRSRRSARGGRVGIFRRRIFTDSSSDAAQVVEENFICTSHNCGLYWKVKIMVETGSELPSPMGIGHWKSGSNEASVAKSDLAVKPSGRSLPDTDDPHFFREARAAFISGGVRLFGMGKSDICRHLQKMDESVLPLSKVPIRV